MGRRDYAILLLLARLGLSAGEVVVLRLEDVNWREGTLAVRCKGALHDRLPIPEDVGESLADYLRHGRLHDARTRRLFVRARAPLRGFANAGAVTTLVQRALHRSGIEAPIRGAYLFRHSLATGMLRGGASLAEVGEVLRHRSTNSADTWYRALKAAHTYDVRRPPLPWLAQICGRTCLNLRRHSLSHASLEDVDEPSVQPGGELEARQDVAHRVRRLLRVLSRQERAAIALCYLHEVPRQMVAVLRNVRPSAVRPGASGRAARRSFSGPWT